MLKIPGQTSHPKYLSGVDMDKNDVLNGSSSSDQLIKYAKDLSEVYKSEKEKRKELEAAHKQLMEYADTLKNTIAELKDKNKELKEKSVQLTIYARDLSLSYKKAKEEEELTNRLSRYVGENLVEKLINTKNGVFFENERMDLTVLFADIRSFTSITESMETEDVVLMLNQYFDIMVDIIFKNNGILDKFVGDQLMSVFGIISSDNNDPYDAVRAAIEMQGAIENLMKVRNKQDKDTFAIGIGINTGRVIAGNVGSENRMDYTIIGDCVNVAARLEQMARGGEIVIGEQTFQQIRGHFRVQKKGEVHLKNKIQPVICYEVLK